MNLFLVILLFALGLVLVVKGGDFFVDAASWMAEASGIPKFIVGATIVSVATTLPEMLVSMIAAAGGKVDMAVGNAVGSVTCNTGLIMGLLVVFMAGTVKRSQFGVKSLLMIAAAVVLAVFGLSGSLGTVPSVLLLILFALFIAENLITGRREMGASTDERPEVNRQTLTRNIVLFLVGTAGIVIGAQLMVDNGSALAAALGVPEAIIGVTMIAVGTSLPELVTAITAIRKRQSQLSVGNIIGANIIDLTVILPLCSLVSGKALPFGVQSMYWDMPACAIIAAIAVIPTLITEKLQRWQGVLLLASYAVYLVLITCVA
ncbi:MAG: calcium/sodium antiporter [Clostridia bacterium]|nr:calcium/sodium antiporter [Clostridia bacterium]